MDTCSFSQRILEMEKKQTFFFRHALDTLLYRQRSCLLLHIQAHFSVEEIALLLQFDQGVVEHLLSQAYQKVIAFLDEKEK